MANGIEEHGARITTVENEVKKLREWRHGPYTESYNSLQIRILKMEEAVKQLSAGGAKFWEIAKPIIIATVVGFIGWLCWVLLQLYHAYPRK